MAAASPAPAQEAALEAMALQLDVSINGSRRASIAAFTLDFAQRMASTRGELLELGIRSPGEGGPEDVVYLDSIPGLVYAYDEAAQAIDIRLGDDHRVTQVYGGKANEFVLPELGTGFFTNYSLYASGSGSSGSADDGDVFDGGSLALDFAFLQRFWNAHSVGRHRLHARRRQRLHAPRHDLHLHQRAGDVDGERRRFRDRRPQLDAGPSAWAARSGGATSTRGPTS